MKVIRNDEALEIKLQAQAELKALQKTSQWKETIDLVDCFTDQQNNTYFITMKPKITLNQYVKSLGDNPLNIDAIALLIFKLCKALYKLHQKNIIHRDICQETISVKMTKTIPSKSKNKTRSHQRAKKAQKQAVKLQIAGLDLAFHLKNNTFEVTQCFNIENKRFAPEMMAGKPHGHPVDVWGLG